MRQAESIVEGIYIKPPSIRNYLACRARHRFVYNRELWFRNLFFLFSCQLQFKFKILLHDTENKQKKPLALNGVKDIEQINQMMTSDVHHNWM